MWSEVDQSCDEEHQIGSTIARNNRLEGRTFALVYKDPASYCKGPWRLPLHRCLHLTLQSSQPCILNRTSYDDHISLCDDPRLRRVESFDVAEESNVESEVDEQVLRQSSCDALDVGRLIREDDAERTVGVENGRQRSGTNFPIVECRFV